MTSAFFQLGFISVGDVNLSYPLSLFTAKEGIRVHLVLQKSLSKSKEGNIFDWTQSYLKMAFSFIWAHFTMLKSS